MDNDKLGEKSNSNKNDSDVKCKSSKSEQKEFVRPSMSSSGNLKVRKSTNLLSAFVKRRKNKVKVKDSILKTVKEPSPNVSFIASSTTINSDESLINVENYEDYDTLERMSLSRKCSRIISNISDSEPNIVQPNSKSKNTFFKKLMRKQTCEINEKKNSEPVIAIQTSRTEACQIGYKVPSRTTSECYQITADEMNIVAPTCYVNFGKPTINITLANGLQLVQELASRLLESENHFIQLFSRYINDPVYQKELLDTLNQHSKLQWETERRTNTLASDMWVHQIEIGRAQERTLQETLNSLVKQNRQLQIDNEILFRRNEKLVKKMRSCNEVGNRHKCTDCENRFDTIIKHNEKLQYKLDIFCQQIQHLENEIHLLQKHNDGLEQQLRTSSHQIHNIKALYQRSKTDYELEIVALNHKAMKHECAIKDALEAGDILLDDIESIKRQTTNIIIPINWSNYKCRGGGIIDLVHLCRFYINELAKELLACCTKIRLQEKDIQGLEEVNARLQENLNKTTSDLDCVNRKIEEKSVKETEQLIAEQRCKLLETDARILKEQIGHQKDKFELEIKSLVGKIDNLENANKAISEKDKIIDQTKIFVTNITSENITLRSQIDSLNKVLSESGAGDVLQELAHCQEQLAHFQSQYYQLLNEKQVLIDQLESLRTDNRTILEHRDSNYNKFNKQLQDFEMVGKENTLLKQQLEAEHQTVLTLQTERMKHLEEKNMLKSIFQHMKSEIARVQKLEGTVTDISKEANKLAMIAEYNKSLGEKLKLEIVERDKTIHHLRSSVEKLNEVQIKNTKEKLSLCYELSEICQEKDKLNNILNMEVKKNMALDDSKKEIAKTASSQIQKFEELQRTERTALKDLIHDLKILSAQRDQLQNDKAKLQQEVAELKAVNSEQLKKFDNVVFAKSDVEIKLRDAITRIGEDKKIITKLNENMTSEVNKYHTNVKHLEKLILQLRSDKEQLNDSIRYLQNNTEKLHKDLNETRKNETDTSNNLNKIVLEKDNVIKEKEEIEKNLRASNEEKQKLGVEIHNVNTICERILADYESALKASSEKEDIFKKELDESKKLLLNNVKEIERLNELLHIKCKELRKVSEDKEQIKEKEKRCDAALKSYENYKIDYEDLMERKFRLEKELCELQVDYRNVKEETESYKKQAENLQQKLAVVSDENNKEIISHKNQLDEIIRKNAQVQARSHAEIKDLRMHLKDLTYQLQNERSSYASLSQIHKEISAKFVKSIKDIVDEKNAKQEAITKWKDVNEKLAMIVTEKDDLQQQVNVLLDGLNDGKNRINELTQEKETSKTALEDLQRRYNELLQKCISLENEVRKPNLSRSGEDLEISKEQIEKLKKELDDNNDAVLSLQRDITKLQQQVTALEFQKSEITLRYHESQRKFQTEQSLCEQLKSTHKLILNSVLKLKEEGRIDMNDCNHIVHMVQCNSNCSDSCDSNNAIL